MAAEEGVRIASVRIHDFMLWCCFAQSVPLKPPPDPKQSKMGPRLTCVELNLNAKHDQFSLLDYETCAD